MHSAKRKVPAVVAARRAQASNAVANSRKRHSGDVTKDTFETCFGSDKPSLSQKGVQPLKRMFLASHANDTTRLSVNRNLEDELEDSLEETLQCQTKPTPPTAPHTPAGEDTVVSEATQLWKMSQKNNEDCFNQNNQWKRVIKYELFQGVKWITKEEQLHYDTTEGSMCQWLLDKMQIIPELRVKWWEFFKKDINPGLSNRQNNVSTRMKDAFMSKLLLICFERAIQTCTK